MKLIRCNSRGSLLRFSVLGIALLGLLLCMPQQAHAIKMIIILYRAHSAFGELDRSGHVVLLEGVGPSRGQLPGEVISYKVTVVQPHTGAQGVAFVHAKSAPAQQRQLLRMVVRIHTVKGSPPFQPGKVFVNATAVHTVKGKVVGGWTWNDTVTLIRK